ncbi:MAG: N-acetylmuramoyl-L-alanine amidase [Chloroflexi bacterium]|nr:N-acetylmuramoyl-L-alanine amidase [Chloroflexota bacterium]
MRRSSSSNGLTRRDLLGLAGMTVTAAGLTCIGGIVGYFLVDELGQRSRSTASDPTPPPARSAWTKQIERPTIITRAEWSAREPNHAAENESGFYTLDNPEGWRDYEGDLRAIYRTVVVHHSVIYKTDDPTTMQEIQTEHLDLRKWADVGYHFGVGVSGQVFEGRSLGARGTHVEQFNSGSVGVVFFGNFEIQAPTQPQIDQGRRLIDWLALRLELTHLAGHGEFNDFTDCPGDNMLPYLDLFAISAGLVRGTGGYQPSPEQLITPTPEE